MLLAAPPLTPSSARCPRLNACFLTWGPLSASLVHTCIPATLGQVLRREGSREVQAGKEVTETRFFSLAVKVLG